MLGLRRGWVAPTTVCVKGGISPRHEAVEGVVRLQLGEPPRDGTATRGRSEEIRHLAESALGMTDLRIRQCAHELITPVAQHKIIGAKSLSQGLAHLRKKLIPGRVSSPVVERLQAVHINERDRQPDSLSPGPIDLVLQFSKARATPQHSGDVIDQIVPPLINPSIEGGLGSIEGGLVAILDSLFPVLVNLPLVKLPLIQWMGGDLVNGQLISVQLALVGVKHPLVSIQCMLGGGNSLLRPFSPLRLSLPVGSSVRVADLLVGSVLLDSPRVERCPANRRGHGTRRLFPGLGDSLSQPFDSHS